MAHGKLTSLQERVLQLAAHVTPPWTLTGGGALAGFYTQHRETRDLDLFFRGQRSLGSVVDDMRERIGTGGLAVTVLRTSSTFSQLEVRGDGGSVVVDLVADPTPISEAPRQLDLEGAQILVDTRYQLLVNKLCALLSRSELRDLVDVQALLGAGEVLERALADAPKQDGGFSPLTLSWCLDGLAIRRLATALGWSEATIEAMEAFRDVLVERILAFASG